MRRDRSFVEGVERAVRDAERGTSAELVVVVAARSGSYLDLALVAAGTVGAAALLVALFAPTLFPPVVVAVEIPLTFALVAWLANRTAALLRAMAPRARMQRQVERAAAWWFVEEAVHGTRGRTGVLVYVSLLETRVAVVPDLGIGAAIPEAALRAVSWRADGTAGGPRSREEVERGIAAIGALLRARFPEDGTPANELSDAPRIVS